MFSKKHNTLDDAGKHETDSNEANKQEEELLYDNYSDNEVEISATVSSDDEIIENDEDTKVN